MLNKKNNDGAKARTELRPSHKEEETPHMAIVNLDHQQRQPLLPIYRSGPAAGQAATAAATSTRRGCDPWLLSLLTLAGLCLIGIALVIAGVLYPDGGLESTTGSAFMWAGIIASAMAVVAIGCWTAYV